MADRAGSYAAAGAAFALLLGACSAGNDGSGAARSSAEGRTAGALTSTTEAGPSSSSSSSSSPAARTTGTTPSSSTSAQPGRTGTVTISAIGDVLPHAVVIRDAATEGGYDFTRQLGAIAPIIKKADVGICQLETTLSADNTRLTRDNSFTAPHELARGLRTTGFDGCSTANNHTWDAGAHGLRDTRKVLKDNDLRAAGPSPTADGAGSPAVYDAPLRVAQLAYSYTLMNSVEQDTTVTPPGHPWLSHHLYAAKGASGVIADARRAKKNGADLVVVSMHWGSQFDASITEDQKQLGDALLRSGAVDLILGAHPHLVQPCAKINDRYALYSLGNFLSTQGTTVGSPVGAQDGVVATVRITKKADGSISQSLTYQPTWVNRGDRHRVELATPSANAESYRRTVSAMSSRGCDAEPAT